MVDYITQFLGAPPEGFEALPYFLASVIMIYMLVLVMNTLIHLFGGK